MIKTLLLTIKKNEAMNTTKIKLRKNLLPWLKEQLSRPGWFKNFSSHAMHGLHSPSIRIFVIAMESQR